MDDAFTKSLTASRSVDEVFSAWTDFERFPEFMENVIAVTRSDDFHSRWTVRSPLGNELNWDVEITLLEPDKRIAWNAESDNLKISGQAVFTGLPQEETQVTVTVDFAPIGIIPTLAAQMFANVEERVETDLGNFKTHLEGMEERLIKARGE